MTGRSTLIWKSLKTVPKSMHLKIDIAVHCCIVVYGIFNLIMYSNLDQKIPVHPTNWQKSWWGGLSWDFCLCQNSNNGQVAGPKLRLTALMVATPSSPSTSWSSFKSKLMDSQPHRVGGAKWEGHAGWHSEIEAGSARGIGFKIPLFGLDQLLLCIRPLRAHNARWTAEIIVDSLNSLLN